ncbi:hypothetical protein Cni_G17482 [Canna indica]|uniref:Uncharacterized protein n=1 Tax=Canna indica TaxID=4628 RepID=A0AAQ3QF62_9LILI|nr:hypothetical protein Cni_G17482 [Canna indica]
MSHKDSPASPSPKSLQSKSTKGSPSSLDPSDSRTLKIKSLTRTPSSSMKQNVRVSDMQQQLSKLQEELNKEKEEKSRAMEELTNLKKVISSQKITGGIKGKIEALEKEVQKAKESERKMLESLVTQTKLLEQTKISLEESKLENKSLRESNKSLESSKRFGSRSSRNLEKYLSGIDSVPADEDIRTLKNELRLSTEAEEKSKIAMDGLAAVLKEVTMEANRAKATLTVTQSELEKVRAEAESLRSSLKNMEEMYQAASEESERLKSELEDSLAAWNEKEKSFGNCIKIFEEEITKAKAENDKLFQSQRTAREENANLRDILKQAVNEASIVKESLEIVRKENSQLQDLLSEKEKNLQGLKQEYECLKVSEAAATDSVMELKSLLAATSTLDSSKAVSSQENQSTMVSDSNTSTVVQKFSSGHWNGHNTRKQNGHRYSLGEPGKFNGYEYGVGGSPEDKGRITSSLSTMSEIRPPPSFLADDEDTLFSDYFDHIDTNKMYGVEQTNAQRKKKRSILRRFGDLLRRKDTHKQNSSSFRFP